MNIIISDPRGHLYTSSRSNDKKDRVRMGPIVFDAGHLEHDDNDDYSDQDDEDQVSLSLFVELFYI